MPKKVKRRIIAGAVTEVEVYSISDNMQNIQNAEPKPPTPQTEAQRVEHLLNASRRRFELLVNTNFDPMSLYVTLTLDNEHYTDDFTEAENILTKYIRRVRYVCPAVRLVGLVGRGEKGRLHFHLIVANASETIIEACWNAGKVKRIEPLRTRNIYDGVDRGSDYTGLARYLFNNHCRSPDQIGKRWKQTRNIQKPDIGKREEVKREYSENKPPKAPKGYTLVECYKTDYGYIRFKYVRTPKERETSLLC